MEQSSLMQPSADSLPGLGHLVLELVGSHPVLEMVLALAKEDLHVLGPMKSCGLPYDPFPICSCLQGVPFYYLIYLLQYCCQFEL